LVDAQLMTNIANQ